MRDNVEIVARGEAREQRRQQRRAEQELAAERERLDKERTHYVGVLETLRAAGDHAAADELAARLAEIEQAIAANDYRIANIRAGKLRALTVSTAKRNPRLPDLPSTAESGVNGADFALWFGLWGPAKLPAGIVAKLNADVRRALADAGVRDKLINLGNDPMDMSSEQFASFVRTEIDDTKRIAAAAGIKPQ